MGLEGTESSAGGSEMKLPTNTPVKIVMLGAGGTGGHIAPHIYRLLYALDRPSRFIICDGDKVEFKNLVRQNFSPADLGENKAKILAERYAAVFGMEAEYLPAFVEDLDTLTTLIHADGWAGEYSRYPTAREQVILLGAVDNDKSRQLCHKAFLKAENLIYIDSGNGEFSVAPPSWRPDLNEPCDLVEEVARLVGYDEIPVTVPPAPVEGQVGLTAEQLRKRQGADELAEYGMVETLRYSFVGDEDYKNFALDVAETKNVSVEIANPLAGDRPFLRRDIIPTLAQTVQRNLRRGVENVSLYEIGHVYLWDPNAPAIPALPGAVKPTDEQLAALDAGLPDQPMHVAGILTGNAVDSGWLGERRAVDWSDAVEAVQRIFDRIGAALTLDQPKAEDVPAQWHPGRAARVMAGDVFVGMVGELHPHVNEALGFPAHSAAFELDLTALFATLSGKPVQAKPISTFPPVKQDLAFTVSTDVTAAELKQVIVDAAGSSLESIELFDVYTGDQLGEDEKSLAYAVTFRAPDKTLASEDSEAIRKRIVDEASKLGAQLRA